MRLWRSYRKVRIRILLAMVLIMPFKVVIRGPRFLQWLLRCWGIFPAGPPESFVWIHAFGPGEMRVAIALVRALPQHLPVVMTSSSPQLGREALGNRVEITPIPLPFLFAWRRFLRRYPPRQLILIEASNLEPVLCLHSLGREVPTALVNGWVTQDWIDRNPSLLLLGKVQVLCVRGDEDRELLAGIGVPRERIFLTGEMKFEVAADPLPGVEEQIQTLAGGRPILIAGSTHTEETPQVLDAFERLGGGDRALLILAPRILPRLEEKLLRKRGFEYVRRSRFPVSGRPAIVLLDSVGELASLYRLAAAAFVGFSLSPNGRGHNPIEPARFAVPIVVGPHLVSFRFLASLFDRADAWVRVSNADELARVWTAWLDAPELARQTGQRAADLVASHQGLAMARTLEQLGPFLGLDDLRDLAFG